MRISGAEFPTIAIVIPDAENSPRELLDLIEGAGKPPETWKTRVHLQKSMNAMHHRIASANDMLHVRTR